MNATAELDSPVSMTLQGMCTRDYLHEIETIYEHTLTYYTRVRGLKKQGQTFLDTVPLLPTQIITSFAESFL